MSSRHTKKDSFTSGCTAVQRIARSLKQVLIVVETEWGLHLPPALHALLKGTKTCDELGIRWEEVTRTVIRAAYCRRGKVGALEVGLSIRKGCKRLFDVPCSCDRAKGARVKAQWRTKMQEPSAVLDVETSKWLRQGVRENLSGWNYDGKGEGVYVPDQQGCLERKGEQGGTLASPGLDENPHGLLRLAVGSKQKGKQRVVTMQSGFLKEQLVKIHESLYSYLTQFGWCVRGDVLDADFRAVIADRREGEKYVSGDYTAATDNLNLNAVLIVVDEICRHLPAEEASLVLSSFRDLHTLSVSGTTRYPILRGSMMGNLLSFPILCLINKVCFDQLDPWDRGDKSWREGKARNHKGRGRVVRINGDDILFAGDDLTYAEWRYYTSKVGLVVNEEKTGLSADELDLNSEIFLARRNIRVRKVNLGFLRPQSLHDSLLPSVMKELEKLHFKTGVYLLTGPLQRAIACRPIPASSVPRRWLRFLLKKRWFRAALYAEPTTQIKGKRLLHCVPVTNGSSIESYENAQPCSWVKSVKGSTLFQPADQGDLRALPYVKGPPLNVEDLELENRVRRASDAVINNFVRKWRGVVTRPPAPNAVDDPSPRISKLPTSKIERTPYLVSRLWLRPVLSWFLENQPAYLMSDEDRHRRRDGLPDTIQPCIGRETGWKFTATPIFFPPPAAWRVCANFDYEVHED